MTSSPDVPTHVHFEWTVECTTTSGKTVVYGRYSSRETADARFSELLGAATGVRELRLLEHTVETRSAVVRTHEARRKEQDGGKASGASSEDL